ncbi:hypothetical protein [Halorussus halophilus]|uniref:hypothetical protein n=1 Tax=Halorussus halophilus TaxID=2650975 RepID=UPI001300D843|nr:hypothetical protein [Halorussus halophilus]
MGDHEWEYETLRPPREGTKKEARDPKRQLNELGAEGWELTATIEYVGGGTKFLILKRPVPVANDDSVGQTDE